MYKKSLNIKTEALIKKIESARFVKKFYLAGGTALALQIGHRQSIDLDFFINNNFELEELINELSTLGKYRLNYKNHITLDGLLDEVKISFFKYDYPQLYPFIYFNNIRLADIRDIAPMKIAAIASRGSKKDFIDLYFLMEIFNLSEILSSIVSAVYIILCNDFVFPPAL